jgi:4-aminobutyrate--pyruvate transaminase
MSKALFANSGSEANDAAIKLAWYYNNAIGRPKKKKLISRHRGYHGVTVATGSLTGLAANHADFDLPIPGVLHTDCPSFYHYAEKGETEDAFAERLADNLERLILSEGPDTIAAFFAEPINGSGGVIVPPKGYFPRIQKILKKYDILFIVDEVICGFGRTGNMFGSDTFGLEPDMITMAKALSAAYMPISALLVNEKIYDAMVSESQKLGLLAHGITYAGHPVCAAVALEALKIYEERDILSHVRAVSPKLQGGLRRLQDHPLVAEARGVGLIGALELAKDKKTREPFKPADGVGAFVQKRALERGLMIRTLRDGAIAMCPPLIINEAEIGELLSILEGTLDDTMAMLEEKRGAHRTSKSIAQTAMSMQK